MADGNGADPVRPRVGELKRRDGVVLPVRFAPTSDENVFQAVTIDGEPILMQADDSLTVDALGPDQRVHCGTNLDQVVSGMARKYMADRLRRGVADGPVDTTDVLQWTKAHWRPRGQTD